VTPETLRRRLRLFATAADEPRVRRASDVLLPAVLLYRLWTFYLPPIWGYFAVRWLERNKHL
jgi:hypothetical protein